MAVLFFRKSTIISFVLLFLRVRLFSLPHSPSPRLISVGDKPHHTCIVSGNHYEVTLTVCSAVMSEHGVEQWSEDAALGRASVEDDGGGYGVVNLYRLGSICKEVQNPVAE